MPRLLIVDWDSCRPALIAEMWSALTEFSERGLRGQNNIDFGEFMAIAAENWFKKKLRTSAALSKAATGAAATGDNQ